VAEVKLAVNGRNYLISCDDGQEPQLEKLGAYLDGKMQQLVQSVGQVGESRLLVMAALLISDELFEAQSKLDDAGNFSETMAGLEEAEETMAAALQSCAGRIETLAQRLQDA
jgi:cell division protein ZapA